MHQRAQKGMWNGASVPYGYRNDNKRLAKDETEAPRVEFIFEWFAKDPSLARLRADLPVVPVGATLPAEKSCGGCTVETRYPQLVAGASLVRGENCAPERTQLWRS